MLLNSSLRPLNLLSRGAAQASFLTSRMQSRTRTSSTMSYIPRDVVSFLQNYPGQKDVMSSNVNLKFYSNEIPMQPDGLKYEDFMKKYEKDYVELEMNHGYIQWLFPIRERGVNPQAVPLQPHEAKAMAEDPVILARLLRSYKTMLKFYGIDLNDGHLALAPNHRERLQNLKDASHNLLRITRILKHLSEVPPLQPHAAPLVLFFTAIHSEGLLGFDQFSMRGESLDRWWSNCFRDEEERKEVRGTVKGRGGKGVGKWGFKDWEVWYEGRGKKGWTR